MPRLRQRTHDPEHPSTDPSSRPRTLLEQQAYARAKVQDDRGQRRAAKKVMFAKKDLTLVSAWKKAFPYYAVTSKKDTPTAVQVNVNAVENRSIPDVNDDRVWFFSSAEQRTKFIHLFPKARPFMELVISAITSDAPAKPKPVEVDNSDEAQKVGLIRQIDRWISDGMSNPMVLDKLNKMGWDLVKVQ